MAKFTGYLDANCCLTALKLKYTPRTRTWKSYSEPSLFLIGNLF